MPRRRFAWLAGWLVGAAVAAWLTPVGPRPGFPPIALFGQWPAGVLTDGRTLVVSPVYPVTTVGIPSGPKPVQLWDLGTGELLASHADRDAPIIAAVVVPGRDCLLLRHGREHGGDDHPLRSRCTVVEARSWRTVGQFDMPEPAVGAGGVTPAPDGSTVVVVCDAGTGVRTRLFELPAGRLIATFERCDAPAVFSRDGRTVALLRNGTEVAVFATADGRELMNARDPSLRPSDVYPFTLSPDGRWLHTADPSVWDVTTGQRHRLDAAKWQAGVFLPDEATVAVAEGVAGRCVVRHFDAATGRHLADRDVDLGLPALAGGMAYYAASPVGSLAVATTWEDVVPMAWNRWLARVPGLEERGGGGTRYRHAIYDLRAGGAVARGRGRVLNVVGPYTLIDDNDLLAVWDMPPRRPLRWIAAAAAVWTAAFALIATVSRLFGSMKKRRVPL